jgi:glycosyltransferase involved in cell wall biosynthesis
MLFDDSDKVPLPKRRVKVRVGKNYGARYNCQPKITFADIYPGSLAPLSRVFAGLDNFAFPKRGYDLFHSFNAIPIFGSTPFIVTFEDYCPRLPPDRYNAFVEAILRRRLLSDSCIAIVAMSHYGLRKFRYQHRDHPELDRLLSKTSVVYPGIPSPSARPKQIGEKLRLLFVGKDYFRKGGPAVVDAHQRLQRMGIPVETSLVSAMRLRENDYIGPPRSARTQVATQLGNLAGLTHYPGLSSQAVRDLMRHSDFLALPTFHDTFGYVSVEAMGCGTPSIVTATCAQPEIVSDGVSGYTLKFDNDSVFGEWRWLYRKSDPLYADAYWGEIAVLGERLATTLAEAWEARAGYENMSANAVETAHKRFGPERAARELEVLYRLAVR